MAQEKAYFVWEVGSNKILKEQKPLMALPPASPIKLLTAMIVLENSPLDRMFVVSETVKQIPPIKLGLEPGDSMSCEDLLHALLIKSANDVAVILAEGVSQNQKDFMDLMNKKAKELGCKNSFFCNPNGLPDAKQYSCAYDLSLIAANAYRYTAIQKILACSKASIKSAKGKTFNLKNKNKFLGRIYGKTGYTDKSQNTFAGVFIQGEKILAFSVIGYHPRASMWNEIEILLDIKEKSTTETKISNSSSLQKNAQNIQLLLQKKGYYKGKIDGIYGAETKAAVKKFQKDHGLKPDGKVGEKTWKKLQEK